MQALLVIDVVNAIFELPVPLHEPDAFLERVRDLIERARTSRVPIFYFRHVGAAGSRFAPGGRGFEIPDVVAPVADDIVIDKREPDMFVGTELARLLAERATTELVMCGFATQDCVDTTVRSAWGKGFDVVLAADAHTTTANPVLSAKQIIEHHNFVLTRLARVVPAVEIAFTA